MVAFGSWWHGQLKRGRLTNALSPMAKNCVVIVVRRRLPGISRYVWQWRGTKERASIHKTFGHTLRSFFPSQDQARDIPSRGAAVFSRTAGAVEGTPGY
jgi:hypothetical protein